jgi:hypothetical protein
MKTALVLSVVVGATLLSAAAETKEVAQAATIVAVNSVPCGAKSSEPLCHEYVLRSGSTDYHVRQKEVKSADLLAVGQKATFTIHDDRMRLHATNAKGKLKDFDLALVLITAASEVNPPNAPQK